MKLTRRELFKGTLGLVGILTGLTLIPKIMNPKESYSVKRVLILPQVVGEKSYLVNLIREDKEELEKLKVIFKKGYIGYEESRQFILDAAEKYKRMGKYI